jgi:hypothetical protein
MRAPRQRKEPAAPSAQASGAVVRAKSGVARLTPCPFCAGSLVEAYLLDTPTPHHGGSGKTFDWSLAASFPHRVIIAGGLDAANVVKAIRIASPWGVDACSRLESAPGKKDPQKVRAFVRAAFAAAHQETAP